MSLAPLPTARKALGRFLARDVVASRSLPGCPRVDFERFDRPHFLPVEP